MHGEDINQSGGSGEAPGATQGTQSSQETGAQPSSASSRGATPSDRMRAFLASRGQGAPEGAPAKVPEEPGAAGEPDDPNDPVVAKVAEVAKRLEAKRAKEAEEAAKQETPETVAERLDPQLLGTEKGRDHLKAWAKATGVDPIALFDALAELGEEHEREAKADPVEKRLAQLEKDREAERERKDAEAKAAREAHARKSFFGSVTADKFPLLSALDEDEIWARGIAAAKMLAKAGEDADAETIAAMAELKLRKLHGKLAAKGGGTTKTAGSAEPRTLSSSLGGETPEPPPFVPGRAGVRQRMKAAAQRRR